jgi:hypothetical protein
MKAVVERASILRYLRKRQRDEPTTLIGEIVAWINGMPKRAKGGKAK